jgi:hypothetical protein
VAIPRLTGRADFRDALGKNQQFATHRSGGYADVGDRCHSSRLYGIAPQCLITSSGPAFTRRKSPATVPTQASRSQLFGSLVKISFLVGRRKIKPKGLRATIYQVSDALIY